MIVRAQPFARSSLILAGTAAALVLRVAVAGSDGASSALAGTLFAAALALIAVLAGWRPSALRSTPLLIGAAGAAVLVVMPVLTSLSVPPVASFPAGAWPLWAAVVSVVAVAEELVLRGILFTLLERGGPYLAVALTSLAFAALHVPIYGWGVFPIDLAVGVWLGGLRLVSGGPAAPAVAHVLADLAAWWLR